MKAEIGTAEKEGFTAAYLIRFDNGLILRTKDTLWIGREETNNLKQQFADVVQKLQEAGVEVVGQERLK